MRYSPLGANRKPWAGRGPISKPCVPVIRNTMGQKGSPFKFLINDWRWVKTAIRAHLRTHWLTVDWFHEQSYIFLQIDDRRTRRICGIVERPDHHWGDDLVFVKTHYTKFLMNQFYLLLLLLYSSSRYIVNGLLMTWLSTANLIVNLCNIAVASCN